MRYVASIDAASYFDLQFGLVWKAEIETRDITYLRIPEKHRQSSVFDVALPPKALQSLRGNTHRL